MRSTYFRLILTLVLAGVALLSCQKEVIPPVQEPDKDVVNAWLSLNLNVVSSGSPTRSATEVTGGSNNGIDDNAIKRLVVYLVPAENGLEDWDEAIMTYIPQISLTPDQPYVASVRTKLNVPFNVYVGANLSTTLAGEILAEGQDAAYGSTATSYEDLISEFASQDMGVAMFCVKPYPVIFTAANADSAHPAKVGDDGNVDLVRMLAKVHVLFKCYDSHPEFVQITKVNSNEAAAFGEFGWSKLSDISYIINTVNKSTKLYQPAYGGYDYADLNHSMSDLLSKGLDWEYKTGAEGNFVRLADESISNENWPSWAAAPERYEASKAPFDSGDPYVKGLYCLENTTDDGSSLSPGLTDDEKTYVPFMVATHIVVKARFVPRNIIYEADINGTPVTKAFGAEEYAEALAYLAEKTVAENGKSVTYPAGTFFTRNMQEFYNYEGMMAAITKNGYTRESFAVYPGGYGFYYSYIYGGTDPVSGKVTFGGTDSGVFRNHYHILNCQLMKVPAVPGSINQLMMVNSKVVDWNNKGSMNITVKPNV